MANEKRPGDGSQQRAVEGTEAPSEAMTEGQRLHAGVVGAAPEGPEGERAPRKGGSFFTDRPVAVLMVFLAMAVFGFLSYKRLPVALMPELSYPTLTVRTEMPGAAPEEVENDVSRRIEEELGVVSGLRRMTSVSRAGVSDVTLELSWDTNMSDAVQEVLEKLDLVRLPAGADRPLILRFDPSLDPVLELSLSGAGDRFAGEEGLRRLRRIAELQVKRALEPIPGVAAVRVRGGLEEEIHVLLDGDELRRTGISGQQVIDRLAQENINVAGGTLKEGRTEYMVRTVNEFAGLGEIRDVVVARIDGRDIRVKDLARVERSHKERQILTRTGGGESVQLDVFKEADANIVALADAVRKRVGELDLEAERTRASQPNLAADHRGRRRGFGRPGGMRGPQIGLATELYRSEGAMLGVVADRSQFIQGSIDDVRSTALIGGVLAVVILFLFLRKVVSTLIVAVSIPLSLLITFAPMGLLGVSLNIMSLGGLALGIGMLVDSSIVVLESIFRCREEGDDLLTGAIRGTREVRSAVVASILTSIAVFFPMVFIEGIAGQAFGDLGLAVVISLLASLLVAVAFIPMLASRRGWSWKGTSREQRRWLRFGTWIAFRDDLTALGRWCAASMLRKVAAVPATLLLAVRLLLGVVLELVGKLAMALVWCLGLLFRRLLAPAFGKGASLAVRGPLRWTEQALDAFINGYEPVLRRALALPVVVLLALAMVVVSAVVMLRGLDTELLPVVHQGEVTIEVALPVGTPLEETERVLSPMESVILGQEHVKRLLVTYGFDPATAQSSDEGEHTAKFKLLLDSTEPAVEGAVVDRLRRRFAELPDVAARVTRPVLFSFQTPIEVEVYGDDLDRLRQYGDRVEELMAGMPELADVETTLGSGAPELQIVYDRDLMARYGLKLGEVAQMVRNQVKGYEATLYNLKDRRIPIVVRLSERDRSSVQDVERLVINPGADRPIRLGAIADVRLGEGPSEVRRVDGRRVALVRANLGEASLGSAVARIQEVLNQEIDWPADLGFLIAGQSLEWQRSSTSLWLALALSVFLVYVIMAAQFESLVHPLVILLTIPLAFFGTVATLYALDVSLSIVVFLGMIMLAGIVVNNAIVLVDYIQTLRARGLPRVEAIVTAGRVRMRPILMTTATTVLGLVPMALGLGEGAEIRTPMALAVIGGLVTSTALTLIVIPVVYDLMDRLRALVVGDRSEPAPASEVAVRPQAEGGGVDGALGSAVPVVER